MLCKRIAKKLLHFASINELVPKGSGLGQHLSIIPP